MPSDDPTGVSDRGLDDPIGDTWDFPTNPPREPVTVPAPGGAAVIGECTSSHLDGIGGDIGRLEAMTSMYTVPGLDSTPCLVKAARAIAGRLDDVVENHPERLKRLMERLVRMYDVLESRTREPYRLSFDSKPREPLPREVLTAWPFLNHDTWVEDLRALRRGRAIVTGGTPIEEHQQIEGSADDGLADELVTLADRIDAAKAAARAPRRMPQVEAAVAALMVHTPAGMARQSGRPLTGPHLEDPLADHTALIMYHGVYTVLLDARGQPLEIPGIFAPILVPDPGKTLVRRLPPPGLYVSIAKYSSGPYRIDGARVRKVIGGSLGKLTYRILHVEETHEIQRKIQTYIDAHEHAYVAAVVGPFDRRGLSARNLKDGLVGIAYDAIPHMQREVLALARRTYENWDDVAAELGEAILREAIVSTAKNIAVKIVVKKLGVKLVPIIGAATSIWSLFDDEGTRRDRHLIGCVLMYVDGATADDRELAAMVIAKILVQMGREKLMDAITGAAVNGGHSLVRRHARSRQPGTGPEHPAPPASTTPQDDGATEVPADRPVDAAVTADSPPVVTPPTPARPGPARRAPGAPDRGLGDRAADVPATDTRQVDRRGDHSPHHDTGSTQPRERRRVPQPKNDPHAAWERDAAQTVADRNRQRPEDDEAAGRPDITRGTSANRRWPQATSVDPESAAKGTEAARRRSTTQTDDEPQHGRGTSPRTARQHEEERAKEDRGTGAPEAVTATASPTSASVVAPPERADLAPDRVRSSNLVLDSRVSNSGLIDSVSGTRRPDGSLDVTIEGRLGPKLGERLHYEHDLLGGSKVGLPGYDRAHLWGQSFGDEAAEGIAYAPKEVNREFQNRGAEAFLRNLRDTAASHGGTVRLRAHLETYPPGVHPRGASEPFSDRIVSRLDYEFSVVVNGRVTQINRVTISVGPPPRGRVSLELVGPQTGAWADALD